jgi:hypothetical protein
MILIGLLMPFFLVLTAAVALIALRSAWKLRHQRPLTPFRLGAGLLVAGSAIVARAVTTNEPVEFVAIVVAVFVAALIWLGFYGLNPGD